MSRAFTKERDDVPDPLVESHSPGFPVRVTAAGRVQLADRFAAAESPAERKRIEHLLADVVVIDPPEERDRVAFGAAVDVHGPTVGARRFTVVGEHEVDVLAGRVSESSPLGAALLGARRGDVVTWHRPAGDVALTIDAIAYEDEDTRETSPEASH